MNALTNTQLEVADYEYTTKLPQVGMMDYTGVGIQLVEIPSTFTRDVISLVRTCDLILFVLDGTKDLEAQLKKLMDVIGKDSMPSKKTLIVVNKSDKKNNENGLQVSAKTGDGLKRLKKDIWSRLGLIRVYTKSTSGKKADKPMTLKEGATVKHAVKEVHKTMLKSFKFARIFNKTKYSGRKVGLEYVLSDLDTVEIHAG
jgi:ribosome-interacting GTPase 1